MQRVGGDRRTLAIASSVALAVVGCGPAEEAPATSQVEGSAQDAPSDGAADEDDVDASAEPPIDVDESVDLADVGSFTLDAGSGTGSWRVFDREGTVDLAYLVPDAAAEVTLFLPPAPADDAWAEREVAGSGGDALDQTEVVVRIGGGHDLELIFDRSGG